MQTVLIVIHLLIVVALVSIILLQHSEGGGLGARNNAGFMTVRGKKNALTRLTAILAGGFFLTSLALLVEGAVQNPTKSVLHTIIQNKQAPKAISPLPALPAHSTDAEKSSDTHAASKQQGGGVHEKEEQKQSVQTQASSAGTGVTAPRTQNTPTAQISIPKITVNDIAPGAVTPMVGVKKEEEDALMRKKTAPTAEALSSKKSEPVSESIKQ